MSFKNFVSHSIINNNEETTIESKEDESVNKNKSKPDEEYDPRTLYERLQEQKMKKEDEFREATRFSNLVKRIDPEEAEYYKSLSDTKKQLDEETKTKELLAIEEYRRAVETMNHPLKSTAIKKTHNITSGTVHKVNGSKSKKDHANSNILIVKKKREIDHEENENHVNKKSKVDSTQEKSTKVTKSTGLNTLIATYNSDSDSNNDSDDD
ncbi:unnamed protein product [Cunninghamella blakesleeana]